MGTLFQFLLITLIVAFGASIQGAVGLGLGILAVPLLTLIDPAFVPGPILAAGLVLALLMFSRERRETDSSGLMPALFGRLIGIGLASALLAYLPQKQTTLLCSILVLLAVLLSFVNWRIRPTRVALAGVGIVSGFMSTAAAIGGPPMALLYQHETGARLRATLSIYFTFGLLLSLVSLALVGKFGQREVVLFLWLLPGVVGGYSLSGRMLPLVDGRRWTRSIVLLVSGIAALMVMLQAVI